MIKNKRRLALVIVALVLGAALALAVVLSRGDSSESTEASQATPSPAATTPVAAQTTDDDPLAVDPAKQEPLLDKFKSKDPFIPLTVASTGSTGATTGTTTNTSTTGLKAKITVNGTASTVSAGDEVPPGGAVFTISSITASSVTFKLLSGVFENGDSSVTVGVGESVKVTQDGGPSYTLTVVSTGSASSTTTSTASGHSITVLSINESNGTSLVSLEIDKKTYTDKKTGQTFSTTWGEVKVLSIDQAAQTVTIMHGDQTITLRAGQVVVK